MRLVFDRRWYMVAERDGETIAVAITVPDINQVLRRMNGRVLPLRLAGTTCAAASIVDRVRVGFLGVKPEYQHTGVAAALYVEHFDESARSARIKWGEMGWILETNTRHEPGDAGHERARREEVPALRARAGMSPGD